ncbi:MAG: hypothetical protein AB7L94_27660 [Kofleriaceae bacterium]
MIRRAICVLVIVQLVACARQKSNVGPPEIALHAKELVDDGEARMYGDKGEIVEVDADTSVDVHIIDGDLQTPARLTIRELVVGCVAGTDAPTCVASKIGTDPITVRSKLKFDSSRAATTVTFGVMGGALGACIAMCQQGDELARGLAYGGIGVVGVFGLMILLFALGGD